MLPAIERAMAKEPDAEIKALLALTQATIRLSSGDKDVRIAAIRALAESRDPNTKMLLLPLLEKKGADFAEPDGDVRAEAELSLRAIEGRLATGETIGRIFSGVSLGSILLLAALGLAITYGLMGVINMAHGELIMIGAYATYVVQNAFRAHLPQAFDLYLIAAIPVAFATSAVVGMALERSVIRFLYGRPLETLLATWGISLILIQSMRTLFGAQNVQVENPSWMSGGIELLPNLVLPWNRIAIIVFAAAVVTLICAAPHAHAPRPLRARRHAEPRRWRARWASRRTASTCTRSGWAPASRGSRAARCRRSATSGRTSGQSYIVDSFMVVVLGGVGQLAGTVYAALGLGIVDKLLEAWSGAVLAKIAVLVFIIVFIQKRPQGLFALKGRMAEG